MIAEDIFQLLQGSRRIKYSPKMARPRDLSYLEELKGGINFKVIAGKQQGSKLVVKGKFAYHVDTRIKGRNESTKSFYYIKCKFATCPARGYIKDDFLYLPNESKVPHTCERDGLGPSEGRWFAQAALGRMKERASKETSTFEVSINAMLICNCRFYF